MEVIAGEPFQSGRQGAVGCTAASDGCALLRYGGRKDQKRLLGVSSFEKVPYLVMPDTRMSGTTQESGFLLIVCVQMVGILMCMCSVVLEWFTGCLALPRSWVWSVWL